MPVEKLNIPRRIILITAAKTAAAVAAGGGGGLWWHAYDRMNEMENERRDLENRGFTPDSDVPARRSIGNANIIPREMTVERYERREQLEKKSFIGAVMGLLGSFGLLVLLTSDTQETEVDSL